jgi:hypothetical protein
VGFNASAQVQKNNTVRASPTLPQASIVFPLQWLSVTNAAASSSRSAQIKTPPTTWSGAFFLPEEGWAGRNLAVVET